MKVRIALIVIDPGMQPRCETSEETVEEYSAAMQQGAKFPPVSLVSDGAHFYPCDGVHRILAAKRGGFSEIDADVSSGTRRDALLKAFDANHTHGLKLSNADKRHAIGLMLADEEWRQRSDTWISSVVHVSNHLVASVRRELAGDSAADPIRIDKNGRTINTTNQGGKKRGKAEAESSSSFGIGRMEEEQYAAEREETDKVERKSSQRLQSEKPAANDVVPAWRRDAETVKGILMTMDIDGVKELHGFCANLLRSKGAA
jgi:hypothetical protein